LILIIFLVVAAVIVGRIQYGLQRAHVREREALFMYELSTSLAGAHTLDAIARTLAVQLQQMLQATLVQVVVEPDHATTSITVSAPSSNASTAKPEQILPMLAPHRLVGEIRLWRGHTPLPAANGILMQNVAEQGARAIERVQASEADLAAWRDRVPMTGVPA
jgi:hypothetical protein